MGDAVLFVIVTNCGCDCTPISCVPNARLVGETEIVGVKGNSATKAFDCAAAVSESRLKRSRGCQNIGSRHITGDITVGAGHRDSLSAVQDWSTLLFAVWLSEVRGVDQIRP